MIAHVVLFQPRTDLSMADRRALIDTWATALREIPSIRRARVGRRVRIGRSYEDMIRTDFTYAAILEFDDADGIREYLDHPAHEAISMRFFAAIADTLIYDFEVEESADGLRGMLESDEG
jgi:Stress responsive A/B Barrel Domain